MNYFFPPKSLAEVLDYKVDFANRLNSDSDVIESFEVFTDCPALTVTNKEFTDKVVTFWLANGKADITVNLRIVAKTEIGRVFEVDATIQILP